MSDITLTEAATKMVAADVRAFRADAKRYAEYVAEMKVTAETVKEHVAVFRTAFKAANKDATPEQIKAYATKVRNGLTYHVGKASASRDTDWMRLIRQAVENGIIKGNLAPDAIMATVVDVLDLDTTPVLTLVESAVA